MRILIKNGRILDPAGKRDELGNLLIEDGSIINNHASGEEAADRVIDASGCYVMPGLIDLHVHLREPGMEYKETIESGAKAAAAGGYTTVCAMPNTKPPLDSPERIAWAVKRAEETAPIHVLFIGAETKNMEGHELNDFHGMLEAGAIGFSEDGKSVMDSSVYRKAMKEAVKEDALIFAHCEDISLVDGGVMNAGLRAEQLGLPGISNAVEDIITARDLILAQETGCRLHLCHVSTKQSVSFARYAKAHHVKVTLETCPHYFSMCDDEIPADNANYKMNPPLRSREDQIFLKEALQSGIIDVISTDHAPHSDSEKNGSMVGAPFGITGTETAVPLTITYLLEEGYITPLRMAELMSYRPAQILRIPKGTLSVGAAADITIIDPAKQWVIEKENLISQGHNTPFDGRSVHGKVKYTICDGNIVFEEGKGEEK